VKRQIEVFENLMKFRLDAAAEAWRYPFFESAGLKIVRPLVGKQQAEPGLGGKILADPVEENFTQRNFLTFQPIKRKSYNLYLEGTPAFRPDAPRLRRGETADSANS